MPEFRWQDQSEFREIIYDDGAGNLFPARCTDGTLPWQQISLCTPAHKKTTSTMKRI
jgi:hypothetical protein